MDDLIEECFALGIPAFFSRETLLEIQFGPWRRQLLSYWRLRIGDKVCRAWTLKGAFKKLRRHRLAHKTPRAENRAGCEIVQNDATIDG